MLAVVKIAGQQFKVKAGDSAPTLTKNTVKKAATKKKAAKKSTGKAKN